MRQQAAERARCDGTLALIRAVLDARGEGS